MIILRITVKGAHYTPKVLVPILTLWLLCNVVQFIQFSALLVICSCPSIQLIPLSLSFCQTFKRFLSLVGMLVSLSICHFFCVFLSVFLSIGLCLSLSLSLLINSFIGCAVFQLICLYPYQAVFISRSSFINQDIFLAFSVTVEPNFCPFRL